MVDKLDSKGLEEKESNQTPPNRDQVHIPIGNASQSEILTSNYGL